MSEFTYFMEHIGDREVVAVSLGESGGKFRRVHALGITDDVETFLQNVEDYAGTIWYADGTWSDRVDHDYAYTWWEHRVRPEPPTVGKKFTIARGRQSVEVEAPWVDFPPPPPPPAMCEKHPAAVASQGSTLCSLCLVRERAASGMR